VILIFGLYRGIGTFVIITKRAAAWTLSQLQCVGTSITVVAIRLLDLPTPLFVPMRILRMLGSTWSWWLRRICSRGLRCLWTTRCNTLWSYADGRVDAVKRVQDPRAQALEVSVRGSSP